VTTDKTGPGTQVIYWILKFLSKYFPESKKQRQNGVGNSISRFQGF